MLYAFFWVILRRLNFICRRFGTLCLFHLHKQVSVKNLHSSHHLPMKMEQAECSETSAYKIQTQGNYPEESTHLIFVYSIMILTINKKFAFKSTVMVYSLYSIVWGHAVVLLVDALRYKPEFRGFGSRGCH